MNIISNNLLVHILRNTKGEAVHDSWYGLECEQWKFKLFFHFCQMLFWITRQFSFCRPWMHGNVEEFLCNMVISNTTQMKESENVALILEAIFVF